MGNAKVAKELADTAAKSARKGAVPFATSGRGGSHVRLPVACMHERSSTPPVLHSLASSATLHYVEAVHLALGLRGVTRLNAQVLLARLAGAARRGAGEARRAEGERLGDAESGQVPIGSGPWNLQRQRTSP